MFPRPLTGNLVWLLAAGLAVTHFLPSAYAESAASTVRLQALVVDTAAQLRLAYRHHPAERQLRYEQLVATVENWRSADRTQSNDRLLADWLRAAMRSSMPGSRASMPPLPSFERRSIETAAPVTHDKSAGDPFGDDPTTH